VTCMIRAGDALYAFSTTSSSDPASDSPMSVTVRVRFSCVSKKNGDPLAARRIVATDASWMAAWSCTTESTTRIFGGAGGG
jgi:hypothetical protein